MLQPIKDACCGQGREGRQEVCYPEASPQARSLGNQGLAWDRDSPRATKAIGNQASFSAALPDPGLGHLILWREVIISPLHFPACFLVRELIDLNFSRMTAPPPCCYCDCSWEMTRGPRVLANTEVSGELWGRGGKCGLPWGHPWEPLL